MKYRYAAPTMPPRRYLGSRRRRSRARKWFRASHQAAGDHDFLPHSARQLARQRPLLAGELKLLNQLASHAIELLDAVEPCDESKMLFHGQILEKMRLVGHERQTALRLDRVAY